MTKDTGIKTVNGVRQVHKALSLLADDKKSPHYNV